MSDFRKCINMQGNINIQIIKSRRKTIGLEVHTDGQVIVRAPLRISSRELDRFINEHINWIESKIKLMEERNYKKISTGAPSMDSITDEEWLSIKDVFAGRVKYYCNIMGVNVSRITIKNQKTRWGSCSAKGNLNFNYQLYYMPEELMDYVTRKKCHMGFAFDGDADRCLAVDEKGTLINGDYILTICGKYLKDLGRLKDDTVVVTVMSNLGMMLACEKEKIKTVKTKVGDRYVLEEMINNGYTLGGEQSGHIIFLEHNTTGDGLVTALQMASIVKKTGKTLSELASIMKELPQVLANAKVPNNMKNIHQEDEEIKNEIAKIEKALNGVGRVLIRPSGTEPLVRVMLEGENQEEINKMAHDLANLIIKKANK